MDLTSVLMKSTYSKECLAPARLTYKTNFVKSVITLRGPFVDDPDNGIEEPVPNLIYLQNLDVIKFVVQNFCDIIERLVVSFEQIHESEGQKVISYVSNSCFSSVQAITLEHCHGRTLNGLRNVFLNVYNLKFSSITTEKYIGVQVDPEAIKFNQIFPNVYSMIIERTVPSDWLLFDGQMLKMRKFTVQLPRTKDENEILTPYVINFLRTNKQIRHLIVKNCNLRLLKEARDVLPEINFLELTGLSQNYLNYIGEPIYFKIRYLVVSGSNQNEFYTNIVFEGLEWLSLFLENSFTQNCMEFIEKQVINTNLNKLTIHTKTISKEHFLALPQVLSNLQTVQIDAESTFIADDVVTFIETNKFLEDVVLRVRMDASEREQLNENLGQNWINKDAPEGFDRISLKR